jgi:hypothetical protein
LIVLDLLSFYNEKYQFLKITPETLKEEKQIKNNIEIEQPK